MFNRCSYGDYYSGPAQAFAQAKFPGVGQVVPTQILSDMAPICGQTHRTSIDFQVGATSSGANIWQVIAPAGVTFDIWEDIADGKDTQWYQGVGNGAQVKLNPSNSSGTFTYYIANPENATAGFNVTLSPVNLVIPPPPPPGG